MKKRRASQYSFGDIVQLVTDHPDDNRDLISGCTGVVVDFDPDSDRLGVQWSDEIVNGHDCHGNCAKGYGWYVDPEDIVFMSDGEADIQQSDQDILALLI